MRVSIVQIGVRFYALILDGYRTGELVRNWLVEEADIDLDRFTNWLRETGYDVVV